MSDYYRTAEHDALYEKINFGCYRARRLVEPDPEDGPQDNYWDDVPAAATQIMEDEWRGKSR